MKFVSKNDSKVINVVHFWLAMQLSAYIYTNISVKNGWREKGNVMCCDSQNKMLKIMAMNVLRKVASDLQAANFYSIMMDECTDISNKEQVI